MKPTDGETVPEDFQFNTQSNGSSVGETIASFSAGAALALAGREVMNEGYTILGLLAFYGAVKGISKGVANYASLYPHQDQLSKTNIALRVLGTLSLTLGGAALIHEGHSGDKLLGFLTVISGILPMSKITPINNGVQVEAEARPVQE